MSDGSSNTIGLSEIVGTERSGSAMQRRVLGDVARCDEMYDGTVNRAYPAACLAMRDPTSRTALISSIDAWRGGYFTDGRSANMGFTTTLPPNSPSCAYGTAGQAGWGSYSPSSFHTGGVNVALMDGSATFVSETIDTNNLEARLDTSVPGSPYGVWGALGTPSGGESKSL